ncbi:hypothetical protein ECZU50_48040 [Escherichia coli]|nr:hypothetical protein ECZU50_48040 [Escherichia coli]
MTVPCLWMSISGDILHRGHQQVLFVVTQADKTEPCHEWDMAGIQPSPAQAQNIREKTEAVFRLFRPVHPVVPYRPAPAGNWIRWSVRS